MPTHQILMISLSTKFKSKFIQQYHKLHTIKSFMNHQHCPNFIIPNNSTIQKFPKTNKTTWSNKDFQPNYMMFKIHTKANNKMTMSHHQALNKTWNQQICRQKKWNELTLKSFLDECGAWVLGSWRSPSSSFHENTKKDGPLEDAMKIQKKK